MKPDLPIPLRMIITKSLSHTLRLMRIGVSWFLSEVCGYLGVLRFLARGWPCLFWAFSRTGSVYVALAWSFACFLIAAGFLSDGSAVEGDLFSFFVDNFAGCRERASRHMKCGGG